MRWRITVLRRRKIMMLRIIMLRRKIKRIIINVAEEVEEEDVAEN